MDTVVLVLMLLIAFNFLLKQTFWKTVAVGIIATVAALFAGLMWPYAIEQSKTQIADWLGNTALMLDTSVLLTIEVSLQMAYAMLAVHVASAYPVKPRTLLTYRFLRWFPGLLIFPVLFSGLVYLIFAFPGTPFTTVAWMYAACVLIAIPVGRWLLLYLLPEKELRLELFFLTNALVAILGIVATVNGRTSVAGVSEVNWGALAGVGGITIIGSAIGLVWRRVMLDVYLAGYLFDAVKYGAQMVLIGDADQLPSVGPGAVLSEMIASGCIPVVRLDKVFRQNAGSRIATNAKLIRHGNVGLEYGDDFQ